MILAVSLLIIIGLFLIAYFLIMWPRSTFFGFYPYGVKTDKKIIALSFDDGPSDPYTSDLLDILIKYNVRATFFLVGKNLEKAPELGRKIIDAGQVIGNHSYSHKLSQYIIAPSFAEEIKKTQEIIYGATQKNCALFRSTWLLRYPLLFKTLDRYKLTPISGIFGTQKEVWQVSDKVIYKDALKQIAPGRILIFHDGVTKNGNRSETIKAIDQLIPELIKQGYEFLTVDELLGIKAYQ